MDAHHTVKEHLEAGSELEINFITQLDAKKLYVPYDLVRCFVARALYRSDLLAESRRVLLKL